MKKYMQKSKTGFVFPAAGEKVFEISVPTFVRGKNASGELFEEKTRLRNISSELAVFTLANNVVIGEKLYLRLCIPKTLILKNTLNVSVSGEVERTRRDSENGSGQIIELTLCSSYEIKREEGRHAELREKTAADKL